MSETTGKPLHEQSAAPPSAQLCSKCRHELRGSSGLRHYGTHTAHQESECLMHLHADIATLRGQVADLSAALTRANAAAELIAQERYAANARLTDCGAIACRALLDSGAADRDDGRSHVAWVEWLAREYAVAVSRLGQRAPETSATTILGFEVKMDPELPAGRIEIRAVTGKLVAAMNLAREEP